MVSVSVDIESAIDKLAKWAANHSDPIKAGTEVAQLLYDAAEIRQSGTLAQKAEYRVRAAGLRLGANDFLTDLTKFNYATGEQLGRW